MTEDKRGEMEKLLDKFWKKIALFIPFEEECSCRTDFSELRLNLESLESLIVSLQREVGEGKELALHVSELFSRGDIDNSIWKSRLAKLRAFATRPAPKEEGKDCKCDAAQVRLSGHYADCPTYPEEGEKK